MSKIDDLIQELCPDGVEYTELGNVANILNGYSFKSGKYVSNGIRVIRISDVQKGSVSDKDLKFYPFESQGEIRNYLLRENDLVMSLT
ncbi:MAG TPA: restriction endonuclease subunit S, partial [Candidatus Cloacimonadota bacterium]|nr:restriction endonuclease subunit S [Candidatus Cloacimonadota bacterium]